VSKRKELSPNAIHFTVDDLTDVLRVGHTKVREWIDDGRLPSYKIDSTIFVHSADVTVFVNQFRQANLAGLNN